MVSTKLYAAIYVVLFVLATAQAMIEEFGFLEEMYWVAFAGIIVLSFAKAVVVAGWYQHLRFEPPSVSYVMLSGLLAALTLTLAAAYSIL